MRAKSGFGVWGAILIENIVKQLAQKLRRIILLHFGLVTFWFHLGKTRQVILLGFSDLADVTMAPKTNMIKILKIIQEEIRIILKHIIWENLNILEIGKFENVGKGGGRTILKMRSIFFEHLEYCRVREIGGQRAKPRDNLRYCSCGIVAGEKNP